MSRCHHAILVLALVLVARPAMSQESFIAYEVPEGTVGSQAFGGPVGLDFNVRRDITVTRLGVFDDGSDGLSLTLTARIYNRDTGEELTNLVFAPGEGELIGGSRFKDLTESLDLAAGFHGVMVAEGYGAGELLANTANNTQILWTMNDGGCAIEFVGTARYGVDPGVFPATLDGGTENKFAGGTFEFQVTGEATSPGGIAYTVEAGVLGNNSYSGSLGMDFDVVEPIDVTHLGVFDSGADGLNLTIIAHLYDRNSQASLGSLAFSPEDPGELVGGNRLKMLDEKITLPSGFQGSIVAEGYGADEQYVNRAGGYAGLSKDNGGCLITFVGTGRWGDAGVLPANPDGDKRMNNPFAAGTFQFEPAEVVILPPDPPEQLIAEVEDDQIRLSWNPPSQGAAVAGYHVYQTAPGQLTLTEEPLTETTHVASELIPGVEYCFVVRSVGETDFLSEVSNESCGVPTTDQVPSGEFIAYQVPAGVEGLQNFGGTVGMDFEVRTPIVITRLGVFDHLSDGLQLPITARLFDVVGQGELASLEFTPEDPGELISGSRFKDLPAPILLPEGFVATIVAEGYGDLRDPDTGEGPVELLGNQSADYLGVTSETAGCSIYPTGSRFGEPGMFPATFNVSVVPEAFAAGTFVYGPVTPPTTPPHGGIAYMVPEGTVGNQNFGGVLGMDFIVNSRVTITRLGVCDSGSDGLNLPIVARLWDRETLTELASLSFEPGDPGELIGGSRFKDLAEPIILRGGFLGTITAEGYGEGELLANGGFTAVPIPITWTTDDGGCLLSFVGAGRWGLAGQGYPVNVDGGPVDRYAAGTFAYEPGPACPDEGDTDCQGLEVAGPEGGGPGTYTVTADASDDSGDDIIYLFSASNGVDDPVVIGPQAENTADFDLTEGPWDITVVVDDDPDCPDESVDDTCTTTIEVCPAAGDTTCELIEVTGPEGDIPGTYTVTVTAADGSGDAISYTITADNGVDDPLVAGPQTESTATFELTEGTWTIAATVDDDPDCLDTPGTCATEITVLTPGIGPFLRGDDNSDGTVNISDPQFSLNYQFLGGPVPDCLAALDTNQDGNVNISDPQYSLNYQFLGGPMPPEPFPVCGPSDDEGDMALGCELISCE